MTRRPIEKTTDILKKILDQPEKEGSVSIGEFVKMLGDRGFCLAILVFSLPNSLPIPGIPGFSTITGIPIIFIGFQMLLGKEALWLPKRVAEKQFSRQAVTKIINKAMPIIAWLERFLKPRMLFLTAPLAERAIGILFIALAFIIALPMPGGNFLPGLSMSLLAIAIVQRDGLFLLFSILFSLASLFFMYEVVLLFIKAVSKLFHSLF